jgi:toxin YoeB
LDLKTSSGRRGREAVLDPDFLDDLRWWVRTDRKLALRVLDLVEAILREPFVGIGMPEPLKHVEHTWSRRINQEHRILYRVSADRIDFLQARYHY